MATQDIKRDWITAEKAAELMEKAELECQNISHRVFSVFSTFEEKYGGWVDDKLDLIEACGFVLNFSPTASCFDQLCEYLGGRDVFDRIRSLARDKIEELTEDGLNTILGDIPINEFYGAFADVITNSSENSRILLLGMIGGLDKISTILDIRGNFEIDGLRFATIKSPKTLYGIWCFNDCLALLLHDKHLEYVYPVFPAVFAMFSMFSTHKYVYHKLFLALVYPILMSDPKDLKTDDEKMIRLMLETKMTTECLTKLMEMLDEEQ